jgi:hypothetical protein
MERLTDGRLFPCWRSHGFVGFADLLRKIENSGGALTPGKSGKPMLESSLFLMDD